MATATIPVDLRNPGQVFACLGFMEAAEILCGPCEGGFDYQADEIATTFTFGVEDAADPAGEVVRFLTRAKAVALAPLHPELSTEKWDVETIVPLPDAPGAHFFPCEPPDSPAALPILLTDGAHDIPVNHWADGSATGRDNVKFWAGAGGLPGVVMLDSAIDLVRAEKEQAYVDPLNFQRPQSSSFRFDWRSGYIPMDIGWSLNNHQKTKNGGYPLVDVLAAIGLCNARPLFLNKLLYRYGVLQGAGHRPLFLRAGLGRELVGFSRREFKIELGWPGKEGQARAIVGVTEVKAEKERA
jgi:CRISPR-associated protein Csx14